MGTCRALVANPDVFQADGGLFQQGGPGSGVRGSLRSVAKSSEKVFVVGFPYPCCSNEPRSKSIWKRMAWSWALFTSRGKWRKIMAPAAKTGARRRQLTLPSDLPIPNYRDQVSKGS